MVARSDSNILALDVGAVRIGVAVAHSVARLPRPLTTLANSPQVIDEILRLAASEQAGHIVVGLPRNLSGDETPQSAVARAFAEQLASKSPVPVSMQDEALTSVKAEEELQRRGVRYTKKDIDALAAAYILEDYLHAHHKGVC